MRFLSKQMDAQRCGRLKRFLDALFHVRLARRVAPYYFLLLGHLLRWRLTNKMAFKIIKKKTELVT